MKRITDYRITLHGVDHNQYFVRPAILGFDGCATGCGSTEKEALEDALESLAQADWDVGALEETADFKAEVSGFSDVVPEEIADIPEDEECSLYVYVSMDVAGPAEEDFDVKAFFAGYVECALWSSTEIDAEGNMGPPLDENYGPGDLSPDCYQEMKKDCLDFCEANSAELHGLDAAQCGHDFWLTRNGHGAGFWDRGLGELGERLTRASKPYGSVDLYAHEGKVHS